MPFKLVLSILVRVLLLPRAISAFVTVSITPYNSVLLQQKQRQWGNNQHQCFKPEPLFVSSSTMRDNAVSSDYENYDTTIILSSTLRQLFPKLIAWKQQYGNPNIPLGASDGRQCQLVRRLHIQQKLTAGEVELLEDIGFTFQLSLEDLYYDANFEKMFTRLAEYQKLHPDGPPIPKKYRPDPELGAWATGLRRLGADRVEIQHVTSLNSIQFQWTSPRSCGSKFMIEFRDIAQRAQQHKTNKEDYIKETPDILQWIQKQRKSRMNSKMSETRYHYMVDLLGDKWMEKYKIE